MATSSIKRFGIIFVIFVALLSLVSCGKKEEPQPEENNNGEPVATHSVEIEIENYGTIKLDLFGKMAPITVENFVSLAKDGFYNGLTFHRVITGFMIQGGDPEGTGYGSSSNKIKGEFAANGFNNPLLHTRGVISMARAKNPNSASCQFFIMHQDAPHLDGSYAAFGIVTEGIEIVDAICENTPVVDRNGTVLAENQPKIKEVRVTEK